MNVKVPFDEYRKLEDKYLKLIEHLNKKEKFPYYQQ